MSRKQTRRSVSVTRELYERLVAYAVAHDISASQIVTQAIRAVIRGDIPLEPAADPAALQRKTKDLRGRK